jgi:hypothetical protein
MEALMELREFVSTSLLQIVQGVVDSSEEIAALGGAVSPVFHEKGSERFLGRTVGGDNLPVYSVDFDVALTVNATADATSETIKVVAIASSATTDASRNNEETFSRLQFMVPLQLPVDVESKKAADDRTAADRARIQQQNSRRGSPGIGWQAA